VHGGVDAARGFLHSTIRRLAVQSCQYGSDILPVSILFIPILLFVTLISPSLFLPFFLGVRLIIFQIRVGYPDTRFGVQLWRGEVLRRHTYCIISPRSKRPWTLSLACDNELPRGRGTKCCHFGLRTPSCAAGAKSWVSEEQSTFSWHQPCCLQNSLSDQIEPRIGVLQFVQIQDCLLRDQFFSVEPTSRSAVRWPMRNRRLMGLRQ